jgi:phytoene desaturase
MTNDNDATAGAPTTWPTEPQDDTYDVVVVGSGLGGLSAGSLTASAGLKTLVVERSEALGGYAHTFQRRDYRFDPAIHWTPQGGKGGLIDAVLTHLGTNEAYESIKLDHLYEAVFPGDVRVRAPTDFDGMVEAHQQVFPTEAEGIRRFFELARTVHVEGHQMPIVLSLQNLDETAQRFPEFFRLMRLSMTEVLDECVTDPKVKALLAGSWPFMGTVPSRLSFGATAQTLMNAAEGTYLAKGGFSSLVRALAYGLLSHGGEVVTGNGAAEVHVEDGSVAGLTLANGQDIRTSTIISNADARQTLHELVGSEHLPKGYARKLDRMTVSHSAFVVFLTISSELKDVAHETIVHPDWDHETAAGRIAAGEPAGIWVSAPSVADPSLAPPGCHAVVVTSLAAYDIGAAWDDEQTETFRERLLDLAGQAVPALRESAAVVDTATPHTMARFCSNHNGAIYGWEATPKQTGTRRLAHHTPVRGLLLSGHWSLPGANALRVFASGVHAAQLAVREHGLDDAIPTFAAAALPSVD